VYIINKTRKNAVVEYLDYQIPVTQLRKPNPPPTRDLNIWLSGRQTDLSAMGVIVGVANFCLGIDETNTFQLNLKSQFYIFNSFWDIRDIYDFF